jgi:hypothetical protein
MRTDTPPVAPRRAKPPRPPAKTVPLAELLAANPRLAAWLDKLRSGDSAGGGGR